MRSVRRTWLLLLTAALLSAQISCAAFRRSAPVGSARPSCPLPSKQVADEFSRFVWDPSYPATNQWIANILEYCWHEEYQETN